MTVINKFIELFGDGHFVLCRGKKAINNRLYRGLEAQAHVDSGGQLGLWIPDGFIAVDVDDRDQSDILSKMTTTLKVKTKKGMHFYFSTDKEQKQRVKAHTPIGLIVDTRTANKGYVVLPINDEDRELIEGPIDPLPFWIEPLNISSKSPAYIIPNAGEGSGRNDALLKQVMRLRSYFEKDDLIKIVQIINLGVFKDPLDETELNQVLSNSFKYNPVDRNENDFLLYNANGNATGVNHLAIVEHLIREYRMFILGTDDLYYYTGGVYVNNGMYVRDLILRLIATPKFQKQSEVLAIYRLLLDRRELVIEDDMCNFDKTKINFLNGMFDVELQQLLPHSPDYLSTIQLSYNYVENTLHIEDLQFYDFLKRTKMNNDEITMMIKYLAYCLLPTNHLKAFLVLVGQTNTGKSTLINIISKILGSKNVSNLSIHQLSERFYPSELKDKLLNANADNGTFALTSIENLKKITGNDKIMWEKKGRDPYFFSPTTRLLFSFNTLPLQVEERSNAFWERLRILEMNNQLNISQRYYEDLVSDESIMSIIPILCKAAKDLTNIPHSVQSQRLSDNLRNESDSIRAYMSTAILIDYNPKTFTLKDELFINYTEFCMRNDLKVQPRKQLFKALEDEGLKEVRRGEGRRYGYYGISINS